MTPSESMFLRLFLWSALIFTDIIFGIRLQVTETIIYTADQISRVIAINVTQNLLTARRHVNGSNDTYGSRLVPEEEGFVGERVREHLEIGTAELGHFFRTVHAHTLSLHFPRTLQPIQLLSHYKWSQYFVLQLRFLVAILPLASTFIAHLWP